MLLILIVCLCQGRVVLAEQIKISVDQTIFAFSANPESISEIKINVTNTSDKTQKMSIAIKDFVQGGDGLIVSMKDRNEQFGMSEWISPKEREWILEPQKTKEVILVVSVPKDATVGAHYAICNIQTFPEVDGQNFQNTIVGGQVGVYVLLNVKGDVSGSGNLQKFKAPIVAGSSVPLKVDFENTGNILYIPHGEILLENIFTRKKSVVETEKHFVFPGTKYSFEIKWEEPSIFGAYSAQANFVDANGVNHKQQRFFLGRFFLLIPIILVGLIFLVRMIIKKMKNRNLKGWHDCK